MSQKITVIAEPRTCSGSTAARRLRRAGIIPAVIAAPDGATSLIQLNAHDFERVMSGHSNAQIMMTVSINGKESTALLREIQRNGLTGRITHADFSQIDTTRKMRLQIQIVVVGEPEGVRIQNGVLEQQLRSIEVECLPTDVVESVTIDASALKLGEDITVADLKLDSKIEIITPPETVIANVAEAMEEIVAEAPADGEAAATQPELSVKKGKAAEEGAEAPAAGAKADAKKK